MHRLIRHMRRPFEQIVAAAMIPLVVRLRRQTGILGQQGEPLAPAIWNRILNSGSKCSGVTNPGELTKRKAVGRSTGPVRSCTTGSIAAKMSLTSGANWCHRSTSRSMIQRCAPASSATRGRRSVGRSRRTLKRPAGVSSRTSIKDRSPLAMMSAKLPQSNTGSADSECVIDCADCGYACHSGARSKRVVAAPCSNACCSSIRLMAVRIAARR